MEHLQVILENNNTIKEFAGYYRETVDDKVRVTSSSIKLVGGAIIDILRGKTPKDYDFLDWNDADIKRFVKAGFVYLHETRTATTYKRGDIIVQFLHTKITEFDFMISQTTFRLNNAKLVIDKLSYETKTLIPVSFTNKSMIFASLGRIPHWKKKGFHIKEATYISLVNSARNAPSKNS